MSQHTLEHTLAKHEDKKPPTAPIGHGGDGLSDGFGDGRLTWAAEFAACGIPLPQDSP